MSYSTWTPGTNGWAQSSVPINHLYGTCGSGTYRSCSKVFSCPAYKHVYIKFKWRYTTDNLGGVSVSLTGSKTTSINVTVSSTCHRLVPSLGTGTAVIEMGVGCFVKDTWYTVEATFTTRTNGYDYRVYINGTKVAEGSVAGSAYKLNESAGDKTASCAQQYQGKGQTDELGETVIKTSNAAVV